MPIRGGESVGTAYVKLLADGDDVPDGIRAALKEGDQPVEEAGKRHNRKYLEFFDPEDLRKKMEKMWGTGDNEAERAGSRQGNLFIAGIRKAFEKAKDINSPFDDLFEKIIGRAGSSSGRGSRNDFLNFLGSATAGITRLLLLGPKIATIVGATMSTAFKDAGGGLAGLSAAAATLGPLLLAAGAGLASLAVTAGILTIALGPVVALASGLLGILSALAGTIGFGAVAAITALAGALVPLAAGLGVVVLGLTNLSDSAKDRISSVTQSLRDNFTSLGADVGDILTKDMAGNARVLDGVLTQLRPTILGIADALRAVSSEWVGMLDNPAFGRFVTAIETFLPEAVESLGQSLGNVAIGFAGLFQGSIPLLRRFLGWLESITTRFADWATSVTGQNEIEAFFAKAGDSAKSLGGFLDTVWDLLTEILAAGRGSGNSIFDSMSRGIRDWIDALQQNPDMLKDWFANAEDLAERLGDVTVAFGELFDTLDSPQNRQAVILLTDALEGLLDALEDVADVTSGIANPLSSLREEFAKVGDGVREGTSPLGKFIDKVQEAWQGIRNFFDGLGDLGGGGRGLQIKIMRPNIAKIASDFAPLAARILNRIGSINLLSRFSDPTGSIVRWFFNLRNRILGAIGHPNLFSLFDNPTARIVSWFSSVRSRILNAIGNINLLANMDNPTDQIVSWFYGLGGRIVSAIGSIDLGGIVKLPDIPGVNEPWNASGKIYYGPTRIGVGEAGPEAIVPLDRPLSMVDPSVRALSAFAQGLIPGNTDTSRKIDASGWTLVSPGADPEAVATQVINQLVPLTF